jgi:AraC-like DNA-binding protein
MISDLERIGSWLKGSRAQRPLRPAMLASSTANPDVVFRDRSTGLRKIEVLNTVKILGSSRGLGWSGLKLDVGVADGWSAQDLVVDGHHLVVNMNPSAVDIEVWDGIGWRPAVFPSKSFWVNPAGRPFSVRHESHACFASCTVDDRFVDQTMGARYEIPVGVGINDEILAGLMRAMVACMFEGPGGGNGKFAQQLNQTFAAALAARFGVHSGPVLARGGVAPGQVRTLTKWLQERIADPLSVDDMAERLGLSVAHFSREFRKSVGVTPWRYVIDLRLRAAFGLLRRGTSVAEAAELSGFSNAAHLARTFKQRFGVSPSLSARPHCAVIIEGILNDDPVLRKFSH